MALVDQLKKSVGPGAEAAEADEPASDGLSLYEDYTAAQADGDTEGAYMALKSLIRQCMDEYGGGEGGGEGPKSGLALLIGAPKPKRG